MNRPLPKTFSLKDLQTWLRDISGELARGEITQQQYDEQRAELISAGEQYIA